MKRALFLAIPLVLASGSAFAGQATGGGALALAALVGDQSPQLTADQKIVLSRFLNGETNFTVPAGAKNFIVAAIKVQCRASNVAITFHACEVSFGPKMATPSGRAAHELYATLAEIGVQPNGAAGTTYMSVNGLSCTIDATEIQSNDGGGAS